MLGSVLEYPNLSQISKQLFYSLCLKLKEVEIHVGVVLGSHCSFGSHQAESINQSL